MDLLGLDGIEPGAFGGQRTNKDAHPLPGLLHTTVVLADPLLNCATDMPAGIVPHQDEDPLAHPLQLRAAPIQELGRDRTQGTSIHKTQPGFLPPVAGHQWAIAQQGPIAGQGFGRVIFGGRCLLNQAQWFSGYRPGMQVGVGKTAPPHFILKAQHPIGMPAGQPDQSIAELFFRWYSGSGLVIHVLL